MTVYHAASIIASRSGLQEDAAINNFHFNGDALPAVDAAAIATSINQFWTTDVAVGVDAAGKYISNEMSRTALACKTRVHTVNEVTLAETFVLELTFTLPAATTTASMVSEAAFVISHHGELDGSDFDRRKRGRLYIGPLNEAAQSAVVNTPVRPATNFQGDIVEGLQRIWDNADADDLIFGVWSPTYKLFTPSVAGWVDNAFDTQRRRGPAPTTRTVFTLP